MSTFQHSMTAEEFLKALKRLGFAETDQESDLGVSAAARFFGVSLRAAQLWAVNGPPNPVALCLKLMLAARIDRTKAFDLLLALMPRGAKGVKVPR